MVRRYMEEEEDTVEIITVIEKEVTDPIELAKIQRAECFYNSIPIGCIYVSDTTHG